MFQPLRDLVLIERENIVTEEQRPSGLVVFKSNFNLYQWGEDNLQAADIIQKKKQNKGNIVATGNKCTFFKGGDYIIYKKMTEQKYLIYQGKDCVLVSEADVLCKIVDGEMICHPDNLIIKITKEARDSLFSKKIKRDDGSTVELFMYNPTGSDEEGHNEHFVATGEVIGVGENVDNAQIGDVAILSYLLDNDESVIVGYDGDDKLIVASPKTVYAKEEIWIYANRATEEDKKKQSYGQRLCPHDIQLQKPGDYETMAPVIGLVRGEEIIACDPYVFLIHESNIVAKVSAAGILYSETQKILERKVLSVPHGNTGVKHGDTIICDDFDIFDIVLEGKRISCLNDIDIITVKS